MAEKKITIKLSHDWPVAYIRSKSAIKVKELLEQYTNGRVVVDIYPSGQLYKRTEEAQAEFAEQFYQLAQRVTRSEDGDLAVRMDGLQDGSGSWIRRSRNRRRPWNAWRSG
jgi:hypothetical protein